MKKPGMFDRIKIALNRPIDDIINMGDIVVDVVTGSGEYKDTGSGGERMTYNLLREFFPKRHIFRNVYLTKLNGDTTEIDLVALDGKGIYVFESKNYSGWIFGNSADRYWTATLPNGQKNRFYSPVLQNAGHISALGENLNDTYPQIQYHSLIVFSERCELKKITNTEPDTYIFQRQELRYYLKQLMAEHPGHILSDEDVEGIADWLKEHERPSEEIKQQHIEQIQKAAQTCPWCGSELVERRNKKTGDTFTGCSAFPKCRYIAKQR